MKFIFFGTPNFAVIILKKLLEAHLTPLVVVTAPDKPAGRGQKLTKPAVKIFAEEHNIPVLQPEKIDLNFLVQVSSFKPDVFTIAAYGKILPKVLLDIPPKGTINVHPSLLPYHRGPSPIQGTILAGDKITGVTLMLTDEKMDHGPVITQSMYHITRDTYQELHDKLATLGGEMLIKTLPKWVAGEIKSKGQDHSKATYTKLLTKENGHIDWTKSAEEIDRMVRALNPWPGTWSIIGDPISENSKRVKILAGYPSDEHSQDKPGTITKTKSGNLAVATGTLLFVIPLLQMEGKKPAKGDEVFSEEFLDQIFQ